MKEKKIEFLKETVSEIFLALKVMKNLQILNIVTLTLKKTIHMKMIKEN